MKGQTVIVSVIPGSEKVIHTPRHVWGIEWKLTKEYVTYCTCVDKERQRQGDSGWVSILSSVIVLVDLGTLEFNIHPNSCTLYDVIYLTVPHSLPNLQQVHLFVSLPDSVQKNLFRALYTSPYFSSPISSWLPFTMCPNPLLCTPVPP